MASVRLNKNVPEDAIWEYLRLGGVSEEVLQQAKRELLWEDPAAMETCKLTRVFNYAADGTLEVQVSRLSGETDSFEVRQWTSVQDLKAEIEARMDIPIGEQVLLKGGQELKSFDECLAAYRVTFFSSTLEVLRVEAKSLPEAVGGLQVSLRGAEGIPEGSIISFRAGNKGRQVPLRFDQTFTFPVTKENANPFKIDVFSQFGRARLTLRPAETLYRAEIDSPLGGSLGALELEVRDTAERERHYKNPSPPQPTRVSKRAQRSVLASRYLDEHGLLTYMQGVVQSVLHDKPADPYDYMIRQMQAARRKNDASANSTVAGSEVSTAAAASSAAPSTAATSKDHAKLQADNMKLQADVERLTEENKELLEKLSALQGELAALRCAASAAAAAPAAQAVDAADGTAPAFCDTAAETAAAVASAAAGGGATPNGSTPTGVAAAPAEDLQGEIAAQQCATSVARSAQAVDAADGNAAASCNTAAETSAASASAAAGADATPTDTAPADEAASARETAVAYVQGELLRATNAVAAAPSAQSVDASDGAAASCDSIVETSAALADESASARAAAVTYVQGELKRTTCAAAADPSAQAADAADGAAASCDTAAETAAANASAPAGGDATPAGFAPMGAAENAPAAAAADLAAPDPPAAE